uniref:Uncharacterized protein n=1 Tax=Guillardia theta TaxID=55529 RepID=A0A7S4K9N3_GUITH
MFETSLGFWSCSDYGCREKGKKLPMENGVYSKSLDARERMQVVMILSHLELATRYLQMRMRETERDGPFPSTSKPPLIAISLRAARGYMKHSRPARLHTASNANRSCQRLCRV